MHSGVFNIYAKALSLYVMIYVSKLFIYLFNDTFNIYKNNNGYTEIRNIFIRSKTSGLLTGTDPKLSRYLH